jgi:hypothetical protein
MYVGYNDQRPKLMCHDFNLLQTFLTMSETHWRTGK